MSDLLFTLSGASRAALCPGSMALPRVGHLSAKADAGSAGHQYTQVLIEEGRGAAEERAPEIAERWGIDGEEAERWLWRMRRWDPGVPDGAICELSLAYLEDGSVVEVRGGQGSYEAPKGALFAGTIDVCWSEPDSLRREEIGGTRVMRAAHDTIVWLVDWKFGNEDYVPPIRRNLQVRIGAMMLARWTGAERVVPAICFAGDGAGRWDVPLDSTGAGVPLVAADLAEIEAKARTVAGRGREQRRRLTAGQPLDLVTGDHCRYCPSRPACPAHTSEALALVTGAVDFARAGEISREQAERLAGLLGPCVSVLKKAREALEAYVETHGPIELPDGRVWGPQETKRTRFRARETFEELLTALEVLVGAERAGDIADGAFACSKKAINGALKAARTEAGLKARGIGAAMSDLIAAVDARGGLEVTNGVQWGAHYPGQTAEEDDGQ